MYNDKQDILNTQLNVEEQNNSNSSKLAEREQIDNSPFWIVGNPEDGYFLTMGRFKLTEAVETKLDVILELEVKKWDVIFKLVCILNEEINKKLPQ